MIIVALAAANEEAMMIDRRNRSVFFDTYEMLPKMYKEKVIAQNQKTRAASKYFTWEKSTSKEKY